MFLPPRLRPIAIKDRGADLSPPSFADFKVLHKRIRRKTPPAGGRILSTCGEQDAAKSGRRLCGDRPFRLSAQIGLLARQAWASSCLVSLDPTVIVRGFMRSGRLRTRSMCKRPSWNSAPFTST